MAYTRVYQNRINWKNSPNTTTPLGQSNLNKMDYALNQIDGTLNTWDTYKANAGDVANSISNINNSITTLNTTKANKSEMLTDVVNVSYNTTTGVWTFTRRNGSTFTYDQNIEKIPASFSMDANGVITMKTADGTVYTADISSQIKPYNFDDGTIIDFTKTTDSSGNYHVTADIKSGSITESKLQPNFLANCRTYANNAHSDAILAQSYTKGDTELRPGEETDNATYYYQGAKSAEEQAKTYRDQAEAIAGIQIATTEVFGIVKPDGNTIDINNGILSTGIPDSQWSYIQNLYQ